MNKKTFTLAVIFLCVALVWLGVNIYWIREQVHCVGTFDLIISVLFVLAGAGMVYNECQKKKRQHLEQVNKNKIP